MCKRIIYFIFLISFGYSQHINYTQLDTKNGLPSSELYDVIQDSKGYIWFASDGGVTKFDGSQFTNYTMNDGLIDNTVFHIYEDSWGRVWFSGFNGKICFLYNDRFYALNCNNKLNEYTSENKCIFNTLYVDNNGILYLGNSSADGYFKIYPENNYSNYEIVKKRCLKSIEEIDRKGLIVGSYDFKANPILEFKANLIKIDTNVVKKLNVTNIYKKNNDILFSIDNVLYHFKNDFLIKTTYFNQSIFRIYIDKYDNIWIGFSKMGVYKYSNLDLNTTPNKYFEGLSITSIYCDKESNFWFTSLERGLFHVSNFNIQHFDLSSISTESNIVNIFHSNNDSIIYFNNGSFNFSYAYRNQKFINNNKSSQYVDINSVNNIEINSDYSVYNLGKLIYQNPKKSLIKFSTSNYEFVIFGAANVLYIHDKKANEVEKVNINERINCIAHYYNHLFLLGGLNGLFLLDAKSKTIKPYYFNYPFLRIRIEFIYKDDKNNIWIGTRGNGVYVISPSKTIKFFNQSNGLVNNTCTSIAQDDYGKIWISTLNGLSVIEKKDLDYKVQNITTLNGLSTNEIRDIHIAFNYIFIASKDGVDFFKVNEPLINLSPPEIYLKNVYVNDDDIDFYNEFEFEYNHNNFEFDFIGVTFNSSLDKKFAFILEGYDQSWNYTKFSYAKYTNLPPGEYMFNVVSYNNNNIPSEKPAQYKFIIKKAWWKTITFFIFFNLMILTSLVGAFIWWNRRTKKVISINQQLADSRMTALRAQMNPHFIFNAINSIQHYIITNDKENAYDYLSKFSRLIRKVLDQSRHSEVPLKEEVELLQLYIDLENLRFQEKINVSFNIDENISPEETIMPNMILQPYIENSIVHGLANKKKDLKLSIDFELYSTSVLRIVIEDNGVGRKRASELKANRKHNSVGMLITSERIKTLKELNNIKVESNIVDLYDESGNATGTKVELFIPIKENESNNS